MGDEGEFWNAVNEASRKHKGKNLEEQWPILDELVRSGQAKELTHYQYRIDGKFDVYPANKRFHILSTGKRGRYKDLILFLKLNA
jgi:hypothetical protein